MAAETSLSIGASSKATGTTVEAIRWYERVGVLPAPARTAGNYRAYGTAHLERLSFVRRARDLGFTLDQVREHLGEVERKIADLEALRRELQGLIGQCRHGTVNECRIIEALSPAGGQNVS